MFNVPKCLFPVSAWQQNPDTVQENDYRWNDLQGSQVWDDVEVECLPTIHHNNNHNNYYNHYNQEAHQTYQEDTSKNVVFSQKSL